MRRSPWIRSTIVAIVASVVATTAAWIPAVPAGGAAPVALRVMTFNILYGGDEVNLDSGGWCTDPRGCNEGLRQVVHAIRAADADVVGLQEPLGNSTLIANRLGWHANERTRVISRYPLIDPPGGRGMYVFVRLGPGRVVAVANDHLPSSPYGPYLARNGRPRADVLELERRLRLPWIARQLRVLPRLADRGIPTFFVADFNSPSHLDWTPAVDVAREEVPYPVVWPVAKALADVGFRDSYRDIHPNPVATPGFTWTPGVPTLHENEVHDRIDWVLAAGPSTTVSSEIVGEAGNPVVDIPIDPYPTDHRGVVSEFTLTPGTPPVFAAVTQRRVFRGQDLSVAFHAPGVAGERVAIVRAGDRVSQALRSRLTHGDVNGRITFATTGMRRGDYEAVLIGPNDHALSRSPFWLYARGTPPRVWTTLRAFEEGRRIHVRWAAAPGAGTSKSWTAPASRRSSRRHAGASS